MATVLVPQQTIGRTAVASPVAVAVEPVTPTINYFSIYASSILAVSVLFLLGVGIPLAIVTGSWIEGVALGVFCAVWGGPSFGVMTGSARASAWQEKYGTDH